jgi:hypothetical protein
MNLRTLSGCFVAAAGLAAVSAALHAAPVGRVLLAAGDTVAVREGRDVRLQFGSPIEDKDVLRTGAASSLQVRFVDESLVSLRENSQLAIENYRFADKEDGTERGIFSLVKGGFRKVTGIIGRLNHQNYEVRTPTATVGIRGTDYAVRDCRGDCGEGIKDGLYGSVLGVSFGTNRLAVTNNAGELIFGKDEHFYVADRNTLPQPLLEPPTFVAVKPQGKAQATQEGGSGTGGEQAGGGSGAQGESRPAAVGELPTGLAFEEEVDEYQVAETYTAGGLPAVFPIGTNGLAVSGGGFGFGTFLSSLTVAGSGPTEKLSSFIASFTDPEFGHLFSVTGQEGPGGTDMLGFASGVNGHFGRWKDGTLTFTSGGSSGSITPGTGVHWIYGFDITDPAVFAPKTGVFRFNRVAGTTPTDMNGNIASSSSFGPMFVEFRRLVGIIEYMKWTIGPVTHDFRPIELHLFNSGAGVGFAGFNEDTHSGKCTGGACGTGSAADVFVVGGFAGAAGDHAGMSVTSNSPAGPTASVQLYKCPTCASTNTGIPLTTLGFAFANHSPTGYDIAQVEVNLNTPPYMSCSFGGVCSGGALLTSFNNFPDEANIGIEGSNVNTGTLPPLNGAFGRWNSGEVTVLPFVSFPLPATPGTGIHWLYGDVAPPEAVFARTGLINFPHVIGTSPTDSFGNSGSWNTGANIAVNFTNRTAEITASWTTPGYTWSLNNTPLVFDTDKLSVGLTTPNHQPLSSHPSTSCSGGTGCTGGPIQFVNIEGQFMGTKADHIGTAISTFHGPAGRGTASVQVFSSAPPQGPL